MPGTIVVVTGPKNSGKSTFCRDLAGAAARAGVDVAGICTEKQLGSLEDPNASPSPWPPGHQARWDRLVVTDLRGGEQAVLGLRQDGRWHLLENGFALGRQALAAATPCDLLVVDEIGRLELRGGSGWTNAFQVLAQGSYLLAVVSLRKGGTAAFRQTLERLAPARLPRPRVCELKGSYPSTEAVALQQELLSFLVAARREAVARR